MKFQRGAALPETALSLVVMLAVLVGGLRLALVGYEQISADGAAFYDAHETAIKTTYPAVALGLNPGAATNIVYPHSVGAAINPGSPLPAPTVNVTTVYGFDQTTNRHGGASMVQPLQQLTTVTKSNIDSLSPWTGGSVLSVTGYGVDVAYLETGVHANVAGDDYNAAQSTADAVDYFSGGENTPPYFGGFDFMTYCPWPNTLTVGALIPEGPGWNSCPQPISYRSLGLAEYLTTDNWTRTAPGVTPQGPGLSSGVFWETQYHHDVFAQISSALPPDIVNGVNPGDNLRRAQAILDWQGQGFEAQFALAGHGVSCPPIGSPCNGDTLKVYSWDQIHAAGAPPLGYTPGSLPLSPGAGYPAQ